MDTISPAPSRSGSDTESVTSIPPRQKSPKRLKEQSVFPLAPNTSPRNPPGLSPSSKSGSLRALPPARARLFRNSMRGTCLEAEVEASSLEAVVGVIYHPPAQKTKARKEGPGPAQAEAEVHFPLTRRAWSASVTAEGWYRFQGRGEAGEYVLEWKRRGEKERSRSFSSSSTDRAPRAAADSRFVLGIVDMRTRRAARVASLTKKGFEVGRWERLPLEGLQECVGSSTDESDPSDGQFRTAVYTMVLTTGVWVAAQEGWLG
ncbi:hypothetical protein KXV32_002405 [Aspergillus fumigatus]|nr:hypothetical protein KXV32_002405 [Aspergillus fumigatus]